jgi:hypothetical protein
LGRSLSGRFGEVLLSVDCSRYAALGVGRVHCGQSRVRLDDASAASGRKARTARPNIWGRLTSGSDEPALGPSCSEYTVEQAGMSMQQRSAQHSETRTMRTEPNLGDTARQKLVKLCISFTMQSNQAISPRISSEAHGVVRLPDRLHRPSLRVANPSSRRWLPICRDGHVL